MCCTPKVTGIVWLVALFCLWCGSGEAVAATGNRTAVHTDSIRPLQIGDTIPEALWSMPLKVVNHPDGKDMITLGDYRAKKLIILDFWSTWCTACIHGFRRLDFLGHHFGDSVQFILVNSKNNNTREQVIDFLKNEVNKHQFGFIFPSVVEEANLRGFFPHRYIPHYVWINENGVLQRVTSSNEIDLFSLKDYFREQALFSKK